MKPKGTLSLLIQFKMFNTHFTIVPQKNGLHHHFRLFLGNIHFFVQVVFLLKIREIFFVFLMRGDPFKLKKNGFYIQIHQLLSLA